MAISSHQTPHTIPGKTHPFHFSRAAIGLLSATVILVIILVFSTLQNINRAEMLMEQFLLDKGRTILQAVEAGSRTTMMHHMGGGAPLRTLFQEFVKDSNILYISMTDAEGTVIEQVGLETNIPFIAKDLKKLLSSDAPVTRLDRETGIFNLAKTFEPSSQPKHIGRRSIERLYGDNGVILSIGLLTQQFDKARRQDVHHAIFMGAILFLVGSAGLYFLFLYQKMRLTSSNLADMRIYTQNIIESIPVGILTLDAADQIVSCNRNTEEFFGYPLTDMQGKGLDNALPDCSISIKEACESLIGYETECTGPCGKRTPLRISCSPLLNTHNEVIGKVLIIQDLSLIKEMEIQLERSRRLAALGKMAAGIAHEIRNPLGTLRGFAQFFGNQLEFSPDGKNYSELMISEIDRLNQTVSGLLQFSRPREPQRQEIAMDTLFEKTVSMMKADISSKNVELQCRKDSGISINADPDLMLQVLMNLLKNSINATPAGGTISLSCRRDNHYVKITISDNGCGMSQEIRERMFDPFYTTTRSGTGLGLAVSHQIVEQHGGVFEVATQLQEGTSITILLPQQGQDRGKENAA
jgi:two-component system sensor histidine kinase HydH